MCPVPKGKSHWMHSRPWRAQDKAHPAIWVLKGESWVLVLNSHWKTGSNCFPYWFRYLLSSCRPCKDQPSSMNLSLRFGYHSAPQYHWGIIQLLTSWWGRQGGEEVGSKNRENFVHVSVPCALVMGCKMLFCLTDYGAKFPKIFRPLKSEVAMIFLRGTLPLSCNWCYS